jgi:diketogulonate reductase-like aldo/keto reductase
MLLDEGVPKSMTENRRLVTRRRLLSSAAAISLAPWLGAPPALANQGAMLRREIPKTGEPIPAVGMGTWITFNVGASEVLRRRRLEVLRTFFQLGGGMIDSSPMYGSSQDVIGWCLKRLQNKQDLFSATKVWTPYGTGAESQMAEAATLWTIDSFDLMQVHNLVDWEAHLEVLLGAKKDGRIRYIGVTSSHGSRHREMERIMRDQPIDFVQFTYNILDREAEARLLPMARERNLGVIINRPFRGGGLFPIAQDKPLPDWVAAFDCRNWAQFFLKFILSHPAVTCAIPATSKVAHMRENMGASRGRLPGPETRRRMQQFIEDQ